MIKKLIVSIKELFKKSMESFPVTNICVFVITIVAILNIDIDFNNDLIEKIYLFLSCLGIGSYWIETKRINKIWHVVSFIIALFFVIMFELNLSTEISIIISKVLFTYLAVTIIYSIYNNYKNSSKEFPEYLENVFKGTMKVSLIYGILALSVLIILMIFDFLIMDISKFDVIAKIEIFILGVYYITNILYVLKGEDKSESIVIKGLIRKVLTPLAYISIVIIYLYIIKIFINGNTPEENVFDIISFLFAIDVPILLMASSYKENKLIDKINEYTAFIFIPFIMVQLYVLINTISCSGIVYESYMGIMTIIFEASYLIFSILKKDLGNLFIVAIIMIFVGILVPFINVEDISLYSQYNNLRLYNQNSTYTEKQKTKIYNAYKYINRSDVREEYFEKLDISEEDIEIIKEFNKTEDESYIKNEYDYISANYSSHINIKGYTKLYEVSIYKSNIQLDYIDEITVKYDDNQVKFNFYNQYKNYYNHKNDIDKYFENNNEIVLDKKRKLILTNLDISYTNDEITRYRFDGYLLVK